MPGHEPFLRAIAERPADDTVRLVYADWLDENGSPDHAAFLRLEVQLRRTERGPGWFALCRAFLRAAMATRDDWRELVSRPRLTGTTWRTREGVADEDSLPDEEVEFQPGGTATYRSGSNGGESVGAWRQLGPRVALEINGYSVSRGTVRRGSLRLRGRAISNTGVTWQWTVARIPGPDCIPDLG